MQKHFFYFLFITLISLSAAAQEAAPPVHAMLAYGSEFRPERDVDSNFADHFLTNYALGFGYQQWLFILERASFEESSGNATLSVTRKLEDTLLWTQWRSIKWNIFVPYLGAGLGAYQEKITTQLGPSAAYNESPQKLLGGACFGINLDLPVVWVSLEGRMLFGDELDPQPTLGAIGRIGIWF